MNFFIFWLDLVGSCTYQYDSLGTNENLVGFCGIHLGRLSHMRYLILVRMLHLHLGTICWSTSH